MPTNSITREQVVIEARTWLDTPFKKQGTIKGRAADCLGFPWGVARELKLIPDIERDSPRLKPYLSYGQMSDPSRLFDALDKFLVRIPILEATIADLMLFRVGLNPQHLAIVTDYGIIHSCIARQKVVEHRVNAQLKLQRLRAYRFPVFVE
jgi:cell wall-associated NlpC family hydrolase